MNTIQVTNPEGNIVNYTGLEVLHFINRSKEVDELKDTIERYRKDINNIRHTVRDFFSESEWDNGETVSNKGDVNMLLETIGANKLTSKYRGTFTIIGSFNIEVEDEDDIESIIADNTSVENYDADLDVDTIEINDVEEDD